MSNIWYAVNSEGERVAEFLSRDYDPHKLAEEHGRVKIYDQTDGNKLIEEVVTADLSKFLDAGYREGFGMTREEAWKQGVCVECKQKVHAGPRGEKGAIYSDAGAAEYTKNSAMCETCFDEMFAEPEEDE